MLKGISIRLDSTGENLVLRGDLAVLSSEDKSLLKENKRALIEFLTDRNSFQVVIPKQETLKEHYALSPAQKGIWMKSKMSQDSRMFLVPFQEEFPESVFQISLFNRALELFTKKCRLFKTVFDDQNGEPYQKVVDFNPENHVVYHGFEHENAGPVPGEVLETIFQQIGKLYELPPWQILITKQNGYIRFDFWVHHIIIDGTSIDLVKNEIRNNYEALIHNQEPRFENHFPDYFDYLTWMNEKANLSHFSSFWKNQFQNYVSDFSLVTNKLSESGSGEAIIHTFQNDLKKRMDVFCLSEKVNPSTLFSLAIGIVLSKRSQCDDFCIGVPVSGRDTAELTNIIGNLVNTIPLRIDLDYTRSVAAALEQMQQRYYSIIEHQIYPFSYIVEDFSNQYRVGDFSFYNVLLSIPNQFENLSADEPIDTANNPAFDLVFTVLDYSTEMRLKMEYDTSLFDEQTGHQIAAEVAIVLDQITNNSHIPLHQIKLVENKNPMQKPDLLPGNVNDDNLYPNLTIIEKIYEIAAVNQYKTALRSEDQQISYGELVQKIDAVSLNLMKQGIGKGNCILVDLEISIDQIIAMLAIWKIGAVYVPVDVSTPEQRKTFIFNDCEAVLRIDSVEFLHLQDRGIEGMEVFDKVTGEDLAYILYTSGSTGLPKGVCVSHQCLHLKLIEELDLIDLDSSIQSYCITSPAFDVSFLENTMPLLAGGTVFVSGDHKNIERIHHEITVYQPNILQVTPTYLSYFLNELGAESKTQMNQFLKLVCVGGEKLGRNLIEQFKANLPSVVLNNHYGPTETVIDALVKKNVQIADEHSIGKPLGSVEAYILDDYENLLPKGVPGEIVIAGPTLGLDYLHKRSEKSPFVFSEKLGKRIYKTGDFGMFNSKGEIIFSGRKDSQVKYKGFRIELEEISARIKEIYPGAGVYAAITGEKLVAWVACGAHTGELHVSGLKDQLAKVLPYYMVPTLIIEVPEIPITVNGKTDLKKLVGCIKTEPADDEILNEVEAELLEIWKSALNKRDLSVNDNFFEAGGHSLIAYKICALFNHQVSVPMIYENPTIRTLSKALSNDSGNELIEIPAPSALAKKRYSITPNQRKMWFLSSQFEEWNARFSIYSVKKFDFKADSKKIAEAVAGLLDLHEGLRFCFREEEGNLFQFVNEDLAVADYLHFETNSGAQTSDDFEEYMLRFSFDLQNGPLLKIGFYEDQDTTTMLLVIHHLIADGTSVRILEEDLMKLYLEGSKDVKAEKYGFGNYCDWINQLHYDSSIGDEARSYFNEKAEAVQWKTTVSWNDLQQASEDSLNIAGFDLIVIDSDLRNKLLQCAMQYETTVFTLFMTALKKTLSLHASDSLFSIGVVKSNRTTQWFQDTVGYLLTTVPFFVHPEEKLSISQSVHETAKQLKEIEKYGFFHPEVLTSGKHKMNFNVTASFQQVTEAVILEDQQIGGHVQESKYDMAWDLVVDANNQYFITIGYTPEILSPGTIAQMKQQLIQIVTEITHSPVEEKESLAAIKPLETQNIEFNF